MARWHFNYIALDRPKNCELTNKKLNSTPSTFHELLWQFSHLFSSSTCDHLCGNTEVLSDQTEGENQLKKKRTILANGCLPQYRMPFAQNFVQGISNYYLFRKYMCKYININISHRNVDRKWSYLNITSIKFLVKKITFETFTEIVNQVISTWF